MKIWQDSDNTIRWEKIDGAKRYTLYDGNCNKKAREYLPDDDLSYLPTVVGKHEIKVCCEKSDGTSEQGTIQSREINMSFAYHSAMRSSYCFEEEQLGFTGLNKDELEFDGARYKAYYNVEKGWTARKSEQTDFSKEPYLTKFLSDYKDAGLNVLNPSSFGVILSEDEWEGSGLKLLMDTAWYKFGLKTMVWDDTIFTIPRKYQWTEEQVYEFIESKSHDKTKALYNYMRHPGFYGINVLDEPFSAKEKDADVLNMIETTGYCVKALKRLTAAIGVDCKFACALLKYPYIFKGEDGYRDYLEDWVKYSGADFISFDVYMPATNANPKCGSIVTLEMFETTYALVRETADKYGLRIESAVTAFDNSNGVGLTKVNETDICQNVYYAFSFGSSAMLYFVACPFIDDGAITRTIFGYDGKPTEIYGWVKSLNSRLIKLRALTENYRYTSSNVIIGESLQFIKVLWEDKKGGYAHFYLNMNTSADKSPVLVFVYDKERYVYVKRDGTIEDRVSDGETALWPMSGELVIVFNDKEKIWDRCGVKQYKIK